MSKKYKSYNNTPVKDLKSFEELFNFYCPRLVSYARRFLKDEDEAKDLVQDVFLQLWKSREQLDNGNNISAFIFTLMKNKCLNFLKHKVVEGKYVIQSGNNENEELYHISFIEERGFITMDEMLEAEMESIIEGMPDKCRTAFRLKWFGGKKIHEIAKIMGISTTMVDKHLSKGLQITRKKMDL
jgi:RNA polymerase sigma-70 factor (ECF subfamily)